jgi:hypothetical protein
MTDRRRPAPRTAFKPGDPRINRRGRAPGNKNRFHRSFKEVLTEAIDLMGGAKAIVDWVRKDPANEVLFWTEIAPKLLPRIIEGDPDPPIPLQVIERRMVDPEPDVIEGEVVDAEDLERI